MFSRRGSPRSAVQNHDTRVGLEKVFLTMKSNLVWCTLLLASLAQRASAQDHTQLFEDFESGFPSGWFEVGTPASHWQSVTSGQCGAVTKMLAVFGDVSLCNNVGAGQTSFLYCPAIRGGPLGPLQLSFDYILDIDATGDSVGILTHVPPGPLVLTPVTARLENDGALHSIVLPLHINQGTVNATIAIAFTTDSVGNTGRGLFVDNARVSHTPAGAIFCDGAASTSCPCGNQGFDVYRGCRNSVGQAAALRGSGNPSLGADTFALGVSELPAGSPTLYFEGTAQGDAPFGNGRLCTSGSIVRLGVRISAGGGSSYPDVGGLKIGALTTATAGATRYYQAFYRDVGGLCGATFNVTNAWRVTWGS